MHLDHVGIVIDDLDFSVKLWSRLLNAKPLFLQPPTNVDGEAFALADDATVRVAMLAFGKGSLLELMQFVNPLDGRTDERRMSDLGINHLAFRIGRDDFAAIRKKWSDGVRWNSPVRTVMSGPANGIKWCYGWSADGVRVELTWRPTSALGA